MIYYYNLITQDNSHMNKKECLILIGVSGSGKSSFSSTILNSYNAFRINRDDIRKTIVGDLTNYYIRKDLQQIENIVTKIENQLFFQYISLERNIIIDNTNLTKDYIIRWLELCNKEHYKIKFKLFDCDLKKAKNRVYRRDIGSSYWNLDVDYSKENEVKYIEKQYQQYQSIKLWIEEHYKDKII